MRIWNQTWPMTLFLRLNLFFIGRTEAQIPDSFDTDRLIVKFKQDVGRDIREKLTQELGVSLKERIEALDVDVVQLQKDRVADVMAQLLKNSRIEYVEPDFKAVALELTNDPGIVENKQWGMFKVKAADSEHAPLFKIIQTSL